MPSTEPGPVPSVLLKPLFDPFHDRVLVKQLPQPAQPDGIILPESMLKPPLEGIVYAVGRGRWTEQGILIVPDVQPGDHVLFTEFAGYPVMVDGQEFLLLRDEELIGRRP